MEKRQRRILFLPLSCHAFALIRVQVTPAAAERQGGSDRVSEEASYHRNLHVLPYALQLHFPLPHEALL
jgi:hypothetical protein